mmetsp:Transcript_43245/g.86955  ORF Transcript_43245/g.86955 Transcript_43245/m.86955 type:complete len:99 (+) Transcript_43245:232-528(+)
MLTCLAHLGWMVQEAQSIFPTNCSRHCKLVKQLRVFKVTMRAMQTISPARGSTWITAVCLRRPSKNGSRFEKIWPHWTYKFGDTKVVAAVMALTALQP